MSKKNWQPSASLNLIKRRARMLKDMRAFFDAKNIIEVETPLLASAANTDPHIESFSTPFRNKNYYLNTSPEFSMKRLLAENSVAIYQICKAFRNEELGPMHNPEFTMLEWYRPDFDMHQLMGEVEALVSAVADESLASFTRFSYADIFEKYANLNPYLATANDCLECALQHNIEQPVGLDEDKDAWLDWLLTQLVLPQLPANQFTFIYDYPASQCALARLAKNKDAVLVASRFELFYGETELANGFHELSDAEEQQQRFDADNKIRKEENKPVMAIDANLLAALESGLPNCSGVALGLDRLLMALTKTNSIEQVLSFSWQRV